MSVGPTEEGSIVAHVQAELSDFDAGMDHASARVKELSATEAEVRVDAAAGEAIAKLDAVDRAVNKLGDDNVKASAKTVAARAAVEAAQSRLVASDQRLAAAQAALEAVETSAGRKAATLIPVRVEAKRALDAQTRATLELAAANEALNLSQAADASKLPPKTPGGGGAPGNGGYMAMVVGVVASLVPIMGALAGYVAAVTGSLMGMGAAGVLAVLGIKNAMAQGTAAGNVFSGGLHILKGDLDQLSNTAAVGMLTSFQRAVDLIDSSMPSLNGEIKLFSGMLGTTGDIVLSTLISGFKILLPLFMQGGVYVEQLAVGFQKWTTGGGLAQWARDAAVSLPQVAGALGSLLHAVLAIIGALQPLGGVMLTIITVVGNLASLLTTILGPAFAPVVIGAVAAFAAFSNWKSLGPIIEQIAWKIGLVGVSADAAAGPIGWVVGGVGLLAAALGAVAITAQAATVATQNYTASVQQDNGVIGQNVKAQAAKALSDAGALDAATKLGIAQKTLTDATTGNSSAQEALKKKINALNAELTAMDQANANAATHSGAQTEAAAKLASELQTLTSQYTANKVSIKDAIKAYNDIQSALGGTTITTKAQLDAQTALAASYGESLPEYLAAQGAQKQTADQLKATTDAMKAQGDAAGLLKLALDTLNGKNLTAAQTQNSFDQALNSFTPVTSKSAGSASAVSSAQGSVTNATNSHTNALMAQQIAQNNLAAAQAKGNPARIASAQLALSRANAAVTASNNTLANSANSLVAAQSKVSTTVTTGTSTLEGMSAAAVKNRGTVISLIAAGQTAVEAYRGQTDAQGKLVHSTDDTTKKMLDMRQQIVDAASAAGLNAAQVQGMVDQLWQLSKVPMINVEVDTAAATAKLNAFMALVASLSNTVSLHATFDGRVVYSDARNSAAGHATGGTIGGPSGTVSGPGSSTSDSVLTRLSVGEEVINAVSAGQARPLLKLINQDPIRAVATVMAAGAAAAPQKPGTTVQMTINGAPGQSVQEIGHVAANSLNYMLRSA